MWDAITAEYDLSYGGKLLLCFGLKSLERGRHCSEVIAREGQTIPGRKKGIPKAHPLLSVEHRSRQFYQSVFKTLRIELGRIKL
jgi:hypothetical protein